jgi:hypothetical protein
MRPIDREGIFPNVKYPLHSNPEIREGISEFLKEQDPRTLGKALTTGNGKRKKRIPSLSGFY